LLRDVTRLKKEAGAVLAPALKACKRMLRAERELLNALNVELAASECDDSEKAARRRGKCGIKK
jgi:hypothetical protein